MQAYKQKTVKQKHTSKLFEQLSKLIICWWRNQDHEEKSWATNEMHWWNNLCEVEIPKKEEINNKQDHVLTCSLCLTVLEGYCTQTPHFWHRGYFHNQPSQLTQDTQHSNTLQIQVGWKTSNMRECTLGVLGNQFPEMKIIDRNWVARTTIFIHRHHVCVDS